jgi:hemerythrin-like domain-containing protein
MPDKNEEAAASAAPAPIIPPEDVESSNSPKTSETDTPEETLPKLSPTDFRTYNRLAEMMNHYHNNFRQTWNILYTAAETSKRPNGMSLRQFIHLGLEFCNHLTMHHGIEEQHFFPILAKKMPAFRKELQLLTQHKEIHKGLDKLDVYLNACRWGEKELRMGELKEILDGFGKVLWQHLDDEVKQLGADNMRKYWAIDELRSLRLF